MSQSSGDLPTDPFYKKGSPVEGEPVRKDDVSPAEFSQFEPIIGEISTPTPELREHLLEQFSVGGEVSFTLEGRAEEYSAPILDMRSASGGGAIQVRLSTPRLFVAMLVPNDNGPATAEIYAR